MLLAVKITIGEKLSDLHARTQKFVLHPWRLENRMLSEGVREGEIDIDQDVNFNVNSLQMIGALPQTLNSDT